MSSSTLQIAWRNLWRNPRRTLLALLAIAVGQWALLATQGLMRGYGDNIQRAITGPMIGHIQIHAPGYRDQRAMDLVLDHASERIAEIRRLPGVEDVAPRIYAPVLVAPEQTAYVGMVIGVDMASETKPFGLLSEHKEPLPSGHVLVGYRLARSADIKPGQEVAIVGQAADGSLANDLYTVDGIIKGPVDLVNQSGIVMPLADAQKLLVLPDQVHELMIRATGLAAVPALLQRLRATPDLAKLDITPWRKLAPELVMIIDMVDKVGYFILLLVLIAAVAGIANTLMMATYERMHEFGMLLALGCTPRRVTRMILCEATFLGGIGVAVGSLLGGIFVAITAHTGVDMASWGGKGVSDVAYAGMRLPLQIYPRLTAMDPVVGLVAVILVSLLAALWPAWVAGRLDPMEAMRA
jgi:ABC-type lipoprotein release transport system permease subunit